MFKNWKMMFASTLMIGTMISISSNSWLGIWMGLEINLLSFVPLMSSSKNLMASESSMKYFITQALASSILMVAIINPASTAIQLTEVNLLFFNTALLIKMGAAPFHFWFPEVIEGLNWTNSMILLTWQKIAPMVLLMFNIEIKFLSVIVIACMVISAVMGINQISLRKIMVFSSINHMGWMIAGMMFMETVWTYYFVIYSIITITILSTFKILNTFYLKQFFISMSNQPSTKIFFVMNFLSLGGLPPFLGFFPKWITIQTLVENSFLLLSLVMILMTLFTLYFYLRITFSSLLLASNEPSFFFNSSFSIGLISTLNLIALLGLVVCTSIFNLT